MVFELPFTMKSRYEGNHPHPMFDDNIYTDVLGVEQNKTSSELLNYEKFSRFQHHMKQYYGMVKCIHRRQYRGFHEILDKFRS